MTAFDLTIVIPCYNEYERLPVSEFRSFLESHRQVRLCFVNDASTDKTLNVLKEIQADFTKQVNVLSNQKNLGKAESVRYGMLHAYEENTSNAYAYLDADLATSLEECHSLLQYIEVGLSFVFSSRILKIGSVVDRKFARFLSGRIIATFISHILNIKVYDTQCGCKIFKKDLIQLLFQDNFISKWLFDVEIFSRMLCHYGKETALAKMEEVPVKKWIDRGESKVRLSYFFRLWYNLYRIRKKHRSSINTSK